ncbi:uncharacterized protein Dwil_GK14703 [Drosophila willistoni]|uniref:Uncharacterized protein n=1 Tax=Drosophila willistoni TaxID=7260 RepID=B4MV12_DROWI|nr:nucleolar protein 3 [Drosophila willistoni]EDW76357.1 uncharacterized protein Dwil_GK14703 [Drosophila willistoni]
MKFLTAFTVACVGTFALLHSVVNGNPVPAPAPAPAAAPVPDPLAEANPKPVAEPKPVPEPDYASYGLMQDKQNVAPGIVPFGSVDNVLV